jgi:hypothetical protein
MIKFFTAFLLLLCFCFAVQYSLRIKSLGTDFAYLVPDYETDLYNDPNLLGEKLTGISYEPGLSSPLTMRVLTKRFGWLGNYWASYRNNKPPIASYYPNFISISANDLWMLDLRDKLPKFLAYDVWNLRNDFSYYKKRYYFSDYNYDTLWIVKYLCSSSEAYRIGKYFKIVPLLCGGIYCYCRDYINGTDVEEIDQWLFIYTGRIGLYYRNEAHANKFTSFYVNIGGPMSISDIDNLPYSVFSHLYADEIQQTFFARTLIAQMGFAKGISIDENGFVAIGMRDVLLYQRTNTPDTFFIYPITELRGLRNTLSFPLALEYHIGRVALRTGTRLYYTFKGDREWNSDSVITCYNEHQLHFDYSFGLSWQPHDNFIVDVYNTNYLAELDNWAIYLRYVH